VSLSWENLERGNAGNPFGMSSTDIAGRMVSGIEGILDGLSMMRFS